MDSFFDDFLSHFQVTTRYKDSAQCKCPAHDDKQASLSVKMGTKNPDCIILKCHAGCSNDDILRAAGLTAKDMFRRSERSGSETNWKRYIEGRENKKIVARYDYHSSIDGAYAFTKIRLEGKRIIYGRFENDRFRYGLNGKHSKDLLAVYGNIDRIKQAIEAGETVFITEGEKDTDSMKKLGYVSCSYGSATDWQGGLAELFRNANVIILADNDKSGIEVAHAIYNDLQGVALSSRIIIPTPDIDKGDISDYLSIHTKEDFETLLRVDKEETKSLPAVVSSSEVGFVDSVRDLLLYDDKQKIRYIVRNIETVLEHDARFRNKIRFNEFSHSIDILGALPWKNDNSCRAWGNADDASLFSVLQCDYGFNKRQDCIDALENVAHRNAYNPVKDTLEGLEYRGEGFIRKLLPCYLGCKDTEYTYQVMRLFMLGAVNRIYRAGCKFDYTLMLQGRQGLGKSTFLQLLALDDSWFNDSLDSLDNKDSIQGLIGSWIVELAELKSFTRTTGGMDSIKRFLTATQDKVRLSYARRVEVFPRQCVFAGTTNRADFLIDETGNRRFLVVKAGEVTPTKDIFDKEEIVADISGAWAETMHIFKTENRPLVLPIEFEQEARSMQEQCLVEDVRTGIIEKYLEGRGRTCVAEIWQEALQKEGQPLKYQSREIAEILLSLGYEKIGSRKYGTYGNQRVFEKISKPEDETFKPADNSVPFSA